MKKRATGDRQPELFPRSTRPTIPIEPNHRLVLLTDRIDWTELLDLVESIRLSKVKNAAGRPPQLRALTGALLLKATRDMTWREAADLIRHYAPARYLCGLTETEWSPDHRTLHDFATLLGEDGIKVFNEYTVKWAVAEKLADPSVVVGDTTAQEAAIPYPNEMGLMAAFVTSALAASKHAGAEFQKFASKVTAQVKAAREKVREYRLFAKDKAKAAKNKMVGAMVNVIERINGQLGRAVEAARKNTSRVRKHGNVARAKLMQLHDTRNDVQAGSADPLLAEDRLRRGGEDHQPARAGAVFHRPGQGGQEGGVRTELGHHAIAWGLLARAPGGAPQRVGGRSVRSEVGGGPHRALREGAAGVCVRPSGLQRGESALPEEAGSQTSGPGPPRALPVGGRRENEARAGERARAGGSRNRSREEQPLQLPPSAREVQADDGSLRSARRARARRAPSLSRTPFRLPT